MTLAVLQALSAFVAPSQAGALSPVLALVPLYAISSGKSIDSVYGMRATDAIDGIVDAIPGILTVEMQQAAAKVVGHLSAALDPHAIRAKMIASAIPKGA
jgi:hypothetical protein